VAIVSVQRASQPKSFLIQVARGARRGKLTSGGTFGPVAEDLVAERYSEVVHSLRSEGFRTAGFFASIAALKHKNAGVRARAASRLGWMREPEAVDALIDALPKAVDDVCVMVDALGVLGDPRAIPIARQYAGRKLLSRRRSGAEALRNLGDAEGLADVKNRALERLPATVRAELDPLDMAGGSAADGKPQSIEKLVAVILAAPFKDRGLAIDTLYEIATPSATLAALAALQKSAFDQPHLWRYAKSVHKRSMLRRDFVTFGLLAHAIEARGRASAGTTAKVKSGYDGEEKKMRIFGRATQNYLRRATWRYLRRLARFAPKSYAHAAAEVILRYGPEDLSEPKGRFGALSGCYAFVRVLYGGGDRFQLEGRSMRFKFRSSKHVTPPEGAREEAFPWLWDEEPRAYLRVLTGARLVEAHIFAAPKIAGPFRSVLHAASADEVIALIDAPHEPTVELGIGELERRFDPANPDFTLLSKLLSSERALVRDLGQRWLRLTAPIWTRALDQALGYLRLPEGSSRALAAELLVAHLATASPEARKALAAAILEALRSPETAQGDHDSIGRVGRLALAAELGALLSTEDLMALITTGSAAAKALAGDLLARRPEALSEIGTEQVLALAQSGVSSVRAAARALIVGAIEELKRDPELLFMLVESEWDDTRAFAFDLIREKIDIGSLGLEGVIGLCDSNRTDVQDFGKALVTRHVTDGTGGLVVEDVLSRLVQHPHPNMRNFALDLAVRYLRPGFVQLAKIEPLCRAILFDLWPSLKAKRTVIDFLTARGLADVGQAEVAARILSEYVHTKGRADFERVIEGLVRIGLEHPEVASAVRVLVPLEPGESTSIAAGKEGAP
jgi:hypothetical protein